MLKVGILIATISLSLTAVPLAAQTPEESATQPLETQNEVLEAPHPNRQAITSVSELASAAHEEAVWLDVPGGKALALYRPNYAPKNKGALIIITSLALSKETPELIAAIRQQLPHQGWETLAVDTTTITRAASGNLSDEETPHLKAIYQSAIEFLRSKNNFNLTIAFDNAIAEDLMPIIRASIKDDAKAKRGINGDIQLAMILNTQGDFAFSKTTLSNLFESKNLPIIDVFLGPKTHQLTTEMVTHKAIANYKQLKTYHQIHFDPSNHRLHNDIYNTITSRIRGIMDRIVKGEEIKGNVTKTSPEQQ